MESSSYTISPPVLTNEFLRDPGFASLLRTKMPEEVYYAIAPSLLRMGDLVNELWAMSIEDRENEPKLTSFDAWGNRIDRIELTRVWERSKIIAAEMGLVAAGHEKTLGAVSRIHQFALAYLFGQANDVYNCPLAMTDGAATTIKASKNQDLMARALPRLLSREPEEFWTSGQWMTEIRGGSDVARSTETIAKLEDGVFRLYGRKWFTSATTSEMALTLARPEISGTERAVPGSAGLALFYVETRDEKGRLQKITIDRLKDKMGTRKVPTAELRLEGTPAKLVVGLTDGIRNISPMLNVTRTWNAVTAIALMRRSFVLAKSYAKSREAFGSNLLEKPLHLETLADMATEIEACQHLVFFAVELLGKQEAGEASENELALLRVLTPLAKLYTGKRAVEVISEAIECFGGAGYVEDTGLPSLLRDAHVLPIWEGTTNVLSLDLMKVLVQSADAREALRVFAAQCDDANSREHVNDVVSFFEESSTRQDAEAKMDLEISARRKAFALAKGIAQCLLCNHVHKIQVWEKKSGDSGSFALNAENEIETANLFAKRYAGIGASSYSEALHLVLAR